MVRFPTPITCRSRRRDLYDVRLAFHRIVARLRALDRVTSASRTYSRPSNRAPGRKSS